MRAYNRLIGIFHLTVVCVFASAAWPDMAPHAQEMVMVTPRSPNSPQGTWYILIYSEAFRRLGWQLVYKQFPSKRCSLLANNGDVDGEMERVATYNNLYSNLIRVEAPLQVVKFIALSTDPALKINGWKSLQGKNLRITYRRGLRLCEERLPQVVDQDAIEVVNNTEQGFEKLIARRSDVYIDIAPVAAQALNTIEDYRKTVIQVGVLDEMATHPFLNKKHRSSATALAKVLEAMKTEGLLDVYRKQAGEQ